MKSFYEKLLMLLILFIPFNEGVNPSEIFPTNSTNSTFSNATVGRTPTTTNWTCPYWDDNRAHVNEEQGSEYFDYPFHGSNSLLSHNPAPNLAESNSHSFANESIQSYNSLLPQGSNQTSFVEDRNNFVNGAGTHHQNSNLTNGLKPTFKKSPKTQTEKAQNKTKSNPESQARLRLHSKKIKESHGLNGQLIKDANQQLLRGENPEIILRQVLTGYSPAPIKMVEKRTQKTSSEEDNQSQQRFNPGRNETVDYNKKYDFIFTQQDRSKNDLHFWTGYNLTNTPYFHT